MLGKPGAALDDTRKATSLDPDMEKGWSRMAKCSLLLGDRVSATLAGTRLKKLGQLEGQEVLEKVEILAMYEQSGQTALTVSHYSDGANWYSKSLQLSPYCVAMRVALAECLLYQEKYAEAIEEVNRALDQDNVDTDALFVRGLLFYYQDMMDKALDHFKTVLKLAPDHEQAKEKFKKAKCLKQLKDCGNKAFKAGDFQNALRDYTEALSLDPLLKSMNSKLYFNRATVYTKLGDLQKCLEDCTAALENDPNYLKALLRRAKTYMELKDFENSIQDYEKAHINDPQNIEIKRLRKEAKLEKKKLTRKNYYTVLDIDMKATDDEIKKAYHKQAMKHHPDKHTAASDDGKKVHEQLFKEVGEAFAVLSDSELKAVYDTGDNVNDGEWDVDEDGNIDSEAIWEQFFGGERNTYYSYL
eukprot:GFUD01017536.1.p1 GENE.GFUD01017536.1~~GFUD01017536.1.p1  ORF type:complete len:414 (+),score=120.53 GFUD01017536.1:205-1446(+)